MTGKSFFNGVADKPDLLARFLTILGDAGARYCVIGGLAVNAYTEPVVSLDLDIVIAVDDTDAVRVRAEAAGLTTEHFEHSLNLASPDSDLRIQIQVDPRYQPFLVRAQDKNVLGYPMRVACLEDLLQGKVWAYLDQSRRKSKRAKDLADILRLVEAYPNLTRQLPEEVRKEVD